MRHRTFFLFVFLVLGGCISVPVSPMPKYYSIQPLDKDESTQKFSFPADVIIDFGPVRIPEYLNRPQIITENKDKTLNFSEFNRWSERLDLSLEYVISEDLAAMLPGAVVNRHPWNSGIPARYQATVDVLQFESRLDSDLVFVAQWMIIDANTRKMVFVKRSEFRQPITPHDYYGLVGTLDQVCTSLSAEIAEALSSITEKGEIKIKL